MCWVAWIESHQELARHPKVGRLARTLGVSKVTAVGHLHFLWWWAVDFAQDGDLSVFTDPEIADGAGWEGDGTEFVSALIDAGWVDSERRIHDWMEYAGRLIERRKTDAERKRAERAGTSGAVHTPSAGHPDVSDVTVPNPTEPKPLRASRRVYAYTAEFEEFWSVYAKEGKHDKPKAAAAFTRALLRADLGAILAGARRYAEDPNRDPGHTKYAEGWLNGDRWNDPVLSSKDPKADELEQARIARIADAKRLAESTRGK